MGLTHFNCRNKPRQAGAICAELRGIKRFRMGRVIGRALETGDTNNHELIHLKCPHFRDFVLFSLEQLYYSK